MTPEQFNLLINVIKGMDQSISIIGFVISIGLGGITLVLAFKK